MISLSSQITDYWDKISTIHEKIAKVDENISQENIESWETELEAIQQQFGEFIQNNVEFIQDLASKEDEEASSILNRAVCCKQTFTQDLELLKLTLLFKGRGVREPIQSYMDKYPLAERVLILGCGHHPEHHAHEGAYCIDASENIMPDAVIDITAPTMKYLPTGSFPKVILEGLPTTIFNKDRWKVVFNQLHRILGGEKGTVEFNSMFGMNIGNDFGNIFNLAISEEQLSGFVGKKMNDIPEVCFQYNEKLKNCFANVNFKFAEGFEMETIPKSYTIYKID